jgi:hypothetical protein
VDETHRQTGTCARRTHGWIRRLRKPSSRLRRRCENSFGSRAPGLVSKEALFVRRIWSAAYVQMAQVAQRRFIFLTHASRKIRIVQMLISRGFRHIFQHAKAILNGALTIRRHLIPSWQNVVADVRLLCRRQFLPHLRALLHLLPLRRA